MKNHIYVNQILLLSLFAILLVCCNSTEKDWESAKKANTINAYQTFLTNHADSKYGAEANAKIEILEYIDLSVLIFRNNLAQYSLDPIKLSDRLVKLEEKYKGTPISLSSDNVSFTLGEAKAKIAKESHLIFEIGKPVKYKIDFTDGEIGIVDGNIYIQEGTKVIVNDTSYYFKGKSWINK